MAKLRNGGQYPTMLGIQAIAYQALKKCCRHAKNFSKSPMPTPRKGVSFGVRIEPELKAQVDKMCAELEMEAAALVRAALKSAVSFYEDEGYLHLPLKVIPANSLAEAKTREDAPGQRRKERTRVPTTAHPPQQKSA